MLRKIVRTGIAIAALSMGAQQAQADADVNRADLNLAVTDGEIHVTSSNGTSWDTITTNALFLEGTASALMDTGKVGMYRVHIGVCAEDMCGQSDFKTLLHKDISATTEFEDDISISMSTDDMPQGLSNNVQAQNIRNACNDTLANGASIQEEQKFEHLLKVTYALNTFTIWDTDSTSHNFNHFDHFTVPVMVVCEPVENKKGPDIAFDHGDMKVSGIKLSLKTFSHATTTPNPGTICKKGQLKVRLTANQAGPTKFKLWKKIGDGAITSKVIDAWASHDGNGGFKAEHVEWVSVSKLTYVQAKAEELINPVNLSTAWKNITLRCTSGGGEDFSGHSTDTDDDLLPDPKLTGSLSIGGAGGTKCPRLGQVGFKFNANYSTPINYQLSCTNGIDQSGTLTPSGSGSNWTATGKVMFQNTKTQDVTCALKQIKNGTARVVALGAKRLQCITRTVDTDVNDLTGDPGRPDDPIPTAKLSGEFSFIDRGSPKCERMGRALINFKTAKPAPHGNVHYSLDCTNGHFSGVAQAVSNGKGGYVAPAMASFKITKTTQVTCALKTVAPGNPKTHALKGHEFKCVTRNVDTDVNDLDSDRRPDSKWGDDRELVVIVTPSMCEAGHVRNNTCFCDRTKRRVRYGKKGHKCVDRNPQVVVDPPKTPPCRNGKVRNGKCDCGRNKILKNGACTVDKVVVDPPRKPPCRNGKVRNDKCHCGRNKILKKGTCTVDWAKKRLEDKKKKAAEKAAKRRREAAKAKREADKKAKRLKAKRKAAAAKRLAIKKAKRKAKQQAAKKAKRKAAAQRKRATQIR